MESSDEIFFGGHDESFVKPLSEYFAQELGRAITHVQPSHDIIMHLKNVQHPVLIMYDQIEKGSFDESTGISYEPNANPTLTAVQTMRSIRSIPGYFNTPLILYGVNLHGDEMGEFRQAGMTEYFFSTDHMKTERGQQGALADRVKHFLEQS